jgi:CelD/BcsL family acetyltransferase involved in cellulose biosynthesis
MSEVLEINGIDALEPYRPAWQALLDQTAAGSFFQSLEWLEVYWRHFGEGQKLRVLIVAAAGRPAGILPLAVVPERTRLGQVRTLTYPLHNWGSFYGPIGPDPKATLAAGLEHVCRTPADWDLLELRWAGEASSEQGHSAAAMKAAGLQACRTVWDRTAVIDLGGSWDDYLAARSSKWRNNLLRAQRRLAERGEVRYLRYRPRGQQHGDGDPRWDLYDACRQVASRSWQGGSQSGTTLTHPGVSSFFRDAHAAAARSGMLDLHLLWLDDRPLAFAYNYQCGGMIYGLRAGYDADISREGAGHVLFLHAIRDSFQRGDRLYDLGVGSLDVKRPFLSRVIPIYRYSHFRPAVPRSQLLRLKRWLQHCCQKARCH